MVSKAERLAAWRAKQAAAKSAPTISSTADKPKAPVKISLSLKTKVKKDKNKDNKQSKKQANKSSKRRGGELSNNFGHSDSSEDEENGDSSKHKRFRPLLTVDELPLNDRTTSQHSPEDARTTAERNKNAVDDLDSFMESLEAGVDHGVHQEELNLVEPLSGKSTVGLNQHGTFLSSKKTITLEDLQKAGIGGGADVNESSRYTPNDWESDAASEASSVNDVEEEKARQEFMAALKREQEGLVEAASASTQVLQTTKEVASEKQRIANRRVQIELESAMATQKRIEQDRVETGRIYNDEGDVMEEAERVEDIMRLTNEGDVTRKIGELNKKKELKAVDHNSIHYLPIKKNLFIVPQSLSKLSGEEVRQQRIEINVKVRGKSCPPPIPTFPDSGLPPRITDILKTQSITTPFPIQQQCLPALMAGRDVIGIAKTGSGKTLAYSLPMLRHILAQPPLGVHESGPIGLVLAPARELAIQIHDVCRKFAKNLKLRVTAVYGGGGVADQIGDVKRGAEIIVATPGRLIDILTMRSGKVLNLSRVSYVVMDEADRMFDMGFAPQISSILSAVRPDRQISLFSATFPSSVESLAKKALKFPIEVVVGGRSVASDTIKQHAEVIKEKDKFLRLLQLLGEYVERGKILVFVDTQKRADELFESLTNSGYSCLTLHGGKEQDERDETIQEFKDEGSLFRVLVATSVAGRGLDVPSCRLVINYSTPNHLEDYVHRVGRTGRAGNKGTAYTLINDVEEIAYAPILVRAMTDAKQADSIPKALQDLADSFLEKVKAGEARKATSGFGGSGFTFDASEKSEKQQLQALQRREALIEAGMIAEDETNVRDIESVKMKLKERIENGGGSSNNNSNNANNANNENSKSTKSMPPKMNKPLIVNGKVINLPGLNTAAASTNQEAEEDDEGVIKTITKITTQSNTVHYAVDVVINDYPQGARWMVTKRETVANLQEKYRTSITNKGSYYPPGVKRKKGEERRMYLQLEAKHEPDLSACYEEIYRLLQEESLKSGTAPARPGRYSVL